MTGNINGIVSNTPTMPGLTQDDSFEPYCNASQFPRDGELHRCTHLIQLDLHEIVDFLLIDDKRKFYSSIRFL